MVGGAPTAADPVGSLEIASLTARYAAGELTAVDVVDAVYDRIAAWDDPALFLALLPREEARREAAALGGFDPARPLWGIPCAVKDNIDARPFPTTLACPGAAYVPEDDAAVVAALRRAGALVLGKTNLDQFATGLNGTRSPYGTPRSAIRADLIPGGSSSGSGTAVAAGLVSVALGTDTAGSGRVPAALGGIVGLKPSRGLLSTAGVYPACASLDCVTVFALTVADAARVGAALAGLDPADPYSRPLPAPAAEPAPAPLAGRTLAIPAGVAGEWFGDVPFADAWDGALEALSAAGARLVEVPMDGLYASGAMLYGGAWLAERRAAVAAAVDLESDTVDLDPTVAAILADGVGVSAAGVFDELRALHGLARDARALLADADALLTPTVAGVLTLEQIAAEPVAGNQRLGRFTTFTNLLDLAAVAVPASRVDGVPFGVTLHAPAGSDGALANLASALEDLFDQPLGAPGWARSARAAEGRAQDEPLVAVVGAHLRGQPLHPQLLACGARFVRDARTAPEYGLYALPGTVPPKPGLVRRDEGGAPIAVELYSMPDAGLGALLRSVPRPLGLGRIVLEDGAECVGFVCEQDAARAGVDITGFGGWRDYLATA